MYHAFLLGVDAMTQPPRPRQGYQPGPEDTMTITAKFASRCCSCGQAITPGTKIEWTKGSPVRHTSCGATSATPAASARGRGKNWDPSRFNGYGASRGGYVTSCVTGGNCSSFGSGRSCGGHDCNGY